MGAAKSVLDKVGHAIGSVASTVVDDVGKGVKAVVHVGDEGLHVIEHAPGIGAVIKGVGDVVHKAAPILSDVSKAAQFVSKVVPIPELKGVAQGLQTASRIANVGDKMLHARAGGEFGEDSCDDKEITMEEIQRVCELLQIAEGELIHVTMLDADDKIVGSLSGVYHGKRHRLGRSYLGARSY
jgi:hypothetical protein